MPKRGRPTLMDCKLSNAAILLWGFFSPTYIHTPINILLRNSFLITAHNVLYERQMNITVKYRSAYVGA